MFRRFKILPHQLGLLFRDGAFERLVESRRGWLFDPFGRLRLDIVSLRQVVFVHERLDEIVKSAALKDRAIVLDLRDWQRALVWIDGRFSQILPAGLYALWDTVRDVRVEVLDARRVRFEHDELAHVTRFPSAAQFLDVCDVQRDHVGVLFVDGRYIDEVAPGRYAFWRGMGESRMVEIDQREQTIDVNGQDLMTADKVSLRVNATVSFRIALPRRAVSTSDDCNQSLYRATQMALREVLGQRELNEFLADKDATASDALTRLRRRAEQIGLAVTEFGIRDIVLPGDMKDLMNRVTEAKAAAEANLIARREETAAMRSQANTAKLLEANPVLMRLRELEVLEKVASSSSLQVVLGDGGLGDRLTKLI